MTIVKRGRGRPKKADALKMEAERLAALRKTNETPLERVTRIGERFTVMYRLAQGVINGMVRSLIVSGAPGTGKTHTLDHLLQTAADRDTIKYIAVRGNVTGINLYKLLWRHSSSNCVILLDDTDSIYEDEDCMNVLKAALDTSAVRKISWLSEAASLKSEDIPTQFEFEGAMIFITNKDFQAMIDDGRNKMVPHFRALMSRSIYLDLKLHTLDDLIAWVSHMVLKNHILVQRGLTNAQELDAVKWLQENHTQVRTLDIRTALLVADFIKTDATSWETFAKVTLLR